MESHRVGYGYETSQDIIVLKSKHESLIVGEVDNFMSAVVKIIQ